MKEFEKLLFEEVKRQECEKAILEVELGLFEQKQETTFDFSLYTQKNIIVCEEDRLRPRH